MIRSLDAYTAINMSKMITVQCYHVVGGESIRFCPKCIISEGQKGTYNQLKLADIPSYGQPDNAHYVFGNFNFSASEELGHLDLIHAVISSGEGFDGVPYFGTNSVKMTPMLPLASSLYTMSRATITALCGVVPLPRILES